MFDSCRPDVLPLCVVYFVFKFCYIFASGVVSIGALGVSSSQFMAVVFFLDFQSAEHAQQLMQHVLLEATA